MKKSILAKGGLSLLTIMIMSACNNNVSTFNNDSLLQDTSIQARKSKVSKTLVSIKLKDTRQIADLVAEGLDVFGSGVGGSFEAYVTKDQIEYLQSRKIKFSQSNKNSDLGRGLPAGYHNVQEVFAKVREFASQYPEITSLRDIGDTWEKKNGKGGSDILALTISGKSNVRNKKSIAFISGQHARELAPVEVNLRMMELLLTNYGKDPKITEYLNTREVIFIPISNVDGRNAVQQGNSMWRKNRHIDSKNNGVDLNRNFDGHWNFVGVPKTPSIERMIRQMEDPNSEIFSGQAPFSEPETAALRDFLDKKQVTIVVDLHAYGEMFLWPPGYTTSPVADTPTFQKIGREVTRRNGYRGGTSPELLYLSCGTSKDWGYDKLGAFAFTLEMGSSFDGFRPPYSKVDDIWKKNQDALMYLVSIADNPRK